MNCRQVNKWIDAALDEGLTGERKASFEAHLEACPQCRAQWRMLRAADAALRAPRPVPAPEGMLTEFRRRLAQEEAAREQRSPARLWRWFWPAASFAAAGAAAALVISFNLAPAGSPLSLPQPSPSHVPPAERSPGFAPRVGVNKPSEHAAPAARGSSAARPRAGRRSKTDRLAAAPAPPRRPTPPRPVEMAKARLPGSPPGERRRDLDLASESLLSAPPRPGGPEPVNLGARVEEATRARAEDAGPPSGGSPGSGGSAREGALTGTRFQVAGPRSAGVPIALEANTQLVQSELLPPEFNVSPAVLTALRREVEVEVKKAPVREAVARLTESADVVVRVDPSIQPLRVSVREEGAPLWVALQAVAQQGRLKIVPEDNHLVLVPQAPPAAAAGTAPGPPAGPAAAPGPRKGAVAKKSTLGKPAAPGRLGGIREPELGTAFAQKGRPLPAPDPAVWSEAWGALPRNGFQPPKPEELPPAIAGLPQAMDEARQADRSSSYFFGRFLQQPPAKRPPALPKKAPGRSR